MIVKTLMGRPTGTEIQPEDHQAFALQITDYVRSVELLAGNATPIGFAEADTVPVRPNNGQALYLSQVNRGETVTFNNFIDQDGNAITVVSNENTVTLVNLLWNTLYWTKQETRISLEKSVHGDDIVDGAVTTPKIADGAVTNTKLSVEVQAILNDVANKQNISDATLATIAKTIVGAINEVYKGGLEDASIATSKIKDGAITEDKLASQSVTNAKIANASVSEEKITDNSVSTEKLKDGAITEPKLDTDLTTKVNNNVKTVEQTLALNEIDTVLNNLKFRDTYGNFFADKVSYNSAFKEGAANGSIFGIFCRDNTFGADCYANVCGNNFISNEIGAGCSGNIFGNDCRYNSLGGDCYNNTFGNGCRNNVLKGLCNHNILENGCEFNDLGVRAINVHLCSGVSFVVLKSNASLTVGALQNIRILSGVRGDDVNKLVIDLPDKYLGSSRELIITTKRTDGGPSTPEDIVMNYADEVVDLQRIINTKVKIINEDTDLNTITEDGLYLLSARWKYANYPLSDNLVSSSWLYVTSPSLLVVSHFGITVSQLVLSVSHSEDLPLARDRMYNGTLWTPWSNDSLYKTIWKGVRDSVKNQDLLFLTDTEINNIWDNN